MPDGFTGLRWHDLLAGCAVALVLGGLMFERASRVRVSARVRAVGRWMVLAGAVACLPAASGRIFAYYETVRAAGVEREDSGGVSNLAWYQLARAWAAALPAGDREALSRRAWVGAGGLAMLGCLGIACGGMAAWSKRWLVGLAVVAGGVAAGLMLFHLPRAPGRASVSALEAHAGLAGLVVAMVLAALSARRRAADSDGANGRAGLRALRPAYVWAAVVLSGIAAVATGFAVAGWRWGQVLKLAEQPRDVVHTAGAAVVLVIAVAGFFPGPGKERRSRGRIAGIVLLLATGVTVATGLLMLFDGSDGGSEVYRVRRPIIQAPGRD